MSPVCNRWFALHQGEGGNYERYATGVVKKKKGGGGGEEVFVYRTVRFALDSGWRNECEITVAHRRETVTQLCVYTVLTRVFQTH